MPELQIKHKTTAQIRRDREKSEENTMRYWSFIQTWFKLPEGSRVTRSLRQLERDVWDDVKIKYGKESAMRIIERVTGNRIKS